MSGERHRIVVGDCLESLRGMASDSANCCVTSPPYFGLRDYGVEGQIGLEETPSEFIARLVEVFRQVRRVLREDGTAWVNMGDTYGKGKQLLGIPWRLAFALQDDGWILRQEIIWSKPNPMPESVRDRCTKSHEHIFLLSKSPAYFFDQEAIKEPVAPSSIARLSQDIENQAGSDRVPGKTNGPMKAVRSRRDSFRRDGSKREQAIPGQSCGTHRPDREESDYALDLRNKRSVWSVPTIGFKGAHFATFPPDLIRPCIRAGCQPDGLVLDPFGGSGTTAVVAMQEGRRSTLCELNPEYAEMARKRIDAAWLDGAAQMDILRDQPAA
ncbi:site-specific DNA-methyltransferase [Pseudomonas sp. PS1]|uniref:Methyltransferase n=1 Tax=Stutzerimonas marianensis TaxID=2929513 RepID=A0A9X1W149_9GAMM|nr:site-specific DNA-methyltransferase [Pseudomonas marianensis]MCJ0972732.1 site-specific DNA-methyltransferase [Pseudomonas marianensis]